MSDCKTYRKLSATTIRSRSVSSLPNLDFEVDVQNAESETCSRPWPRYRRNLWRQKYLLWVLLIIPLLGHVWLGRLGYVGFGARRAMLEDALKLIAGDILESSRGDAVMLSSAPKLIPRIIHQTYKSRQLPSSTLKYRESWKLMNRGWEYRFYDDTDCLYFVKREFPQYFDAYKRLQRDVERSDFFRYMVVLRYGGVYADIDTECVRPMDAVIQSKDTLIVGLENEFQSPEEAVAHRYVRTKQILQWVFAGAPGHPALKAACDRIASTLGQTFSIDPRLDTLERTGPGVFTDAVLEAAATYLPASNREPWAVRILPRVAFGTYKEPSYGLQPKGDGVLVQHYFLGSWKQRNSLWNKVFSLSHVSSITQNNHSVIGEAGDAHVALLKQRGDEFTLFPVSVDFDPPFDMLVHLVGHGDRRSGWDESYALSTYGHWQTSISPYRRPSLAQVLVGALNTSAADVEYSLVDIGAGYGLVSLAAAARGHRVFSFELGHKSRSALKASASRNGVEHLIHISSAALGAPEEESMEACVRESSTGETFVTATRRHATNTLDCLSTVPLVAGSRLIGSGKQVGAIRVSAAGREGWVIQGLLPLILSETPRVISVEWNPSMMLRVGWKDPLKVLEILTEAGYGEVSHSGLICDERWYTVTYGVRRWGGMEPEKLSGLKQPTWCRLHPGDWGFLVDRADPRYSETLLFVRRTSAAQEENSSGKQQAAAAENPAVREVSNLNRFKTGEVSYKTTGAPIHGSD